MCDHLGLKKGIKLGDCLDQVTYQFEVLYVPICLLFLKVGEDMDESHLLPFGQY